MPRGLLTVAGSTIWLIVEPDTVRATRLTAVSVNHTAPSEPVVIPTGWLAAVARKPAMAPDFVILAILLVAWSTNQTFPSFPIVMSPGWLFGLLIVNWLMVCVAARAGPAEATAATASNAIPASARPARRRCDMCALPSLSSLNDPADVHGASSSRVRLPPQAATPLQPT